MENGWKPNVEIYPACPRCGSSNTKFCYYNNYSLTQPRYFCKGCRRYWTKGGSLRNIPVGGGCRKTRRPKSIRLNNSHNFLATAATTTTNHRGNTETGGSTVMNPNGASIDLAQVYANFLNQRPENLPSEVDPMLGFSGMPEMEMDFGVTNFGANLENYVSEGTGMQICGYDSIFNDHQEDEEKSYFSTSGLSNYGLPPLPGEELGWSDSNIGFSDHVLNPGIEPDSGGCPTTTFDRTHNSDTIFRP